jgi:GT2 family glycosyltransferase
VAATPVNTHSVSVVIVSWNTKTLLLDALRSFLPFRGVTGEVVVVDNASSDGSAEAVEREFPSARVIRNPVNLGFAGGVNVGLAAAKEPLVCLLNTDTLVVGDALRALVEYAAAHPEAGVVGPRVLNRDGTLQASCFRFPSLLNLFLSATYLYKLFPDSSVMNRERLAGVDLTRPTRVDVVSGCCFLVRRAVLEKVGLLDEGYFMYAEETDFCFRARKAGFEVHYAPVGEIVHFGGGSSRLASRKMFLEFRRSLLRFFAKNHGPLHALAARLLLFVFLLVRTPYWGLRSILPGSRRNEARARLGHHLAGMAFLASGRAKRT